MILVLLTQELDKYFIENICYHNLHKLMKNVLNYFFNLNVVEI